MAINIGDQYVQSDPDRDQPYHVLPLSARVPLTVIEAGREYDGSTGLYLGHIVWRKFTNQRMRGGASVMGSFGRPRNGYVCFEHELIHLFKKPGTPPEPTCSTREREQAAIPKPQWRALFSDIWEFPGEQADRAGHPAPFPEELPRRLLRMFTFPDDLVLDPFVGSGTTCAVARQMGRRYVGVDVNAEYVARARERCQQTGLDAVAPPIGGGGGEDQQSLSSFTIDGDDD